MSMLLRFASAKGKKLGAPPSDDRPRKTRESLKKVPDLAAFREVLIDVVSVGNGAKSGAPDPPRQQTAGAVLIMPLVR